MLIAHDTDHGLPVGTAQTLDPAHFLALVASWSWIANLDDHDRQAALDDVAALIEKERRVEIPYRADLYLARPG